MALIALAPSRFSRLVALAYRTSRPAKAAVKLWIPTSSPRRLFENIGLYLCTPLTTPRSLSTSQHPSFYLPDGSWCNQHQHCTKQSFLQVQIEPQISRSPIIRASRASPSSKRGQAAKQICANITHIVSALEVLEISRWNRKAASQCSTSPSLEDFFSLSQIFSERESSFPSC